MLGADIVNVFFVLMCTATALAQENNYAASYASAKTAMSSVFQLADSESEIDPFRVDGLTLPKLQVPPWCSRV